MAFERMMDQQEDPNDPRLLQRQLENQLNPQPMNQTQPMGAPAPLPASPLPASPLAGKSASQSPISNPAAPSPGAAEKPAMAPTQPPASPLAQAAKDAAAAGYKDIAGAEGLKAGDFVGSLEGFNSNAWGSGERGTNTMKNSFGKIASRYDPTQPGAAQRMTADPDFKAMWPDAVVQNPPKNDVIDFDGNSPMEPVDVITSATEGGGGRGWAWQPQGGADGGGSGGGLDINSLVSGINGGGDPMAAIQAQIAAASNGQDEQSLIQQLLQQQGL